jgi:hypothetical protein
MKNPKEKVFEKKKLLFLFIFFLLLLLLEILTKGKIASLCDQDLNEEILLRLQLPDFESDYFVTGQELINSQRTESESSLGLQKSSSILQRKIAEKFILKAKQKNNQNLIVISENRYQLFVFYYLFFKKNFIVFKGG